MTRNSIKLQIIVLYGSFYSTELTAGRPIQIFLIKKSYVYWLSVYRIFINPTIGSKIHDLKDIETAFDESTLILSHHFNFNIILLIQ